MNIRPKQTMSPGEPSARRRRNPKTGLGAAVGLIAFFGLAGAAWTQGTSDQDLQNRLLGKPSAAADQSAPDCSTPQGLETNPDCGQPVKGGERGFKLFDHGAQPAATSHPAGSPTGRKTAGTPAPRRVRGDHGASAAAACAIGDASNSRAVNLCVTFAVNSTVLTSQSRQSLDRLITALNSTQISSRDVVIEGYADSSGAAGANLTLSDGRAHAVADYLAGHGVARGRIEAKGLGATGFLAGRPSTDPANRRVEARLKD